MANSTQHMFSNAHDFTVTNSNFTAVGGNQINYNYSDPKRHGLELLLANIAAEAVHDAKVVRNTGGQNAVERIDPPPCHENTRVAIRKDIMNWILDRDARRKFILWLFGPAGSGKTAIVRSIAKALAELGLLAASFFFWKTGVKRNNSTHFIATLAYQLSRYIPTMADTLYSAITRDPTIFSKTLARQLQVLIIDPLKAAQRAQPHTLPTPIVLVIDGLDECGPDAQSQTELLDLMKCTVTVQEFQLIPLLVLISSRPEYKIQRAFTNSNEEGLSNMTKQIALDDNYKPDDDIRIYLASEFEKIRDEDIDLDANLPSPWPAKADIDYIVKKASGQFIFAATVITFIASRGFPYNNPQECLEIILGLSPPKDGPFALLDELYLTILSTVPTHILPRLLEVLALLVLKAPDLEINVPHVKHLLGVEVRKTLIEMHALVYVPPHDKGPLSLHHASFSDFLLDKSRSGRYYIGKLRVEGPAIS